MTKTKIQSIIFNKDDFTLEEAKKWIREKGYKESYEGKQPESRGNHWRFRQASPKLEPNHHYITQKISKGIDLIVEEPNQKGGSMGIPLIEAEKLANELIKSYKKDGYDLNIVGSIKRKSPIVNDIDFVTSSPLPNGRKFIKEKVDLNGKNIQIDIWYVPKENLKLASELRSYPMYYSIELRKKLKDQGYHLSDQELTKNGEKIPVNSIKQLAELATIDYHPISYYYGQEK